MSRKPGAESLQHLHASLRQANKESGVSPSRNQTSDMLPQPPAKSDTVDRGVAGPRSAVVAEPDKCVSQQSKLQSSPQEQSGQQPLSKPHAPPKMRQQQQQQLQPEPARQDTDPKTTLPFRANMGPVYFHGHHGVPTLEHRLSASYSNLSKALEALTDDSAVPHSPVPAAVVPALQPSALSAGTSPLLPPPQGTAEGRAAPVQAAAAASQEADVSTGSTACLGCGKGGWTGHSFTALGGKWHDHCWRCAGCLQLLQGTYNIGKADNLPYHPNCFMAAFGKRCAVCKGLLEGSYTDIGGQPMHAECFTCALCAKAIVGSYNTNKQDQSHYHPQCYKQQFGKRCTACGQLADNEAISVKGKILHAACFKCAACQQPVSGKFNTEAATGSHYHPQCYQEKFGKQCAACKQVLQGQYCTVEGLDLHHACFRCQACKLPIEGSCSTSKAVGLHFHSQCYRERFGKRCAACADLLEGSYMEVAGRSLHHKCHTCTACKAPILESKFKLEGRESYHSACHRDKFDPRCDVCAELLPLVNRHIEFCVASFWKQKYCRKHEQSSTPRCCSCNRLKAIGQQWLTLSDKRMVCQDCSKTVVPDTEQAQPLYEDVLVFFKKLGLPLREKPPMMLVDGPTLYNQKQEEEEEDLEDLTNGSSEVTAVLVMYGLPRLLTGSILAHECMHAWFVLNYIDCASKAVNEGLSQLMALMWIEAQHNQVGWEARLASYYAHQIRTHPSEIYGGGLKAALDAFQDHGLRKALLYVKKTGSLPPEKTVDIEDRQKAKDKIKIALQIQSKK